MDVTLDWASRVSEIYKKLVEIEAERSSLVGELEAIRQGAPLPLSRFRHSEPDKSARTIKRESLIPSGGIAKKVHEFMISNPGNIYSPDAVTQALDLNQDKKSVVNTALSRLFRANVLNRPRPGEYILKESEKETDISQLL